MPLLTVCLDSNVIISAIAFRGKPSKVLERALCREFHVVLGSSILQEVERNLTGKMRIKKSLVDTVLSDLIEISTLYDPIDAPEVTLNKGDNLVLEICQMGQCDVLVTGDKKHLLPLSPYKGMIIEPPSMFLMRLEQ